MCILVCAYRVYPETPVVIAANRDEYLSRPSKPPLILASHPRAFGGRDTRSGGTWFGINENGVVAAVTNRLPSLPLGRKKTVSRGKLCLHALAEETAEQGASAALAMAQARPFNGFNLLVLDMRSGWIVENTGELRTEQMPAGWHIIGNRALNDRTDPRVIRALHLLSPGRRGASPEQVLEVMAAACRDHGTAGAADSQDALCVHGEEAGTRSSTLLTFGIHGPSFWYADGPPCRFPYVEQTIPW